MHRTTVFVCVSLLLSAALAKGFAERWRERVDQFTRENAELPADSRNVILLGSSSMEGWRYSHRARFLPQGYTFLNRGISGDGIGISQTTGIKNRLQASVFDCHPTHVFILNGRNSIGMDGARVEQTAQVYREVIEAIQTRLPGVTVCVITCAPTNKGYREMAPHVVRFNARLRALAEDLGCPLIDLHALLADGDALLPLDLTKDGLHFDDAGYRLLAREIERVLREHPASRSAGMLHALGGGGGGGW